MATYGELIDRVQTRVIDLPTAVQDEVPTLINEAITSIQREHNFSVMETLGGPYTTTADTRVLTSMPENFKDYRGLPYWQEEDTGVQHEVGVAPSRQAMLGYFNTLDEGEPQFLLEGEPNDLNVRNWEVWPLTDQLSDYSDTEYRLYVPYYRYLPALSNLSDTNWFTLNAVEYIVYRAEGEAFGVDWDEERMALWLQRGQTLLAEVIRTDKKRKVSSLQTLVPHWRGQRQNRLRIR